MIVKNHKWLSLFCSTLNCSNNFCEVLARQLAEPIYIQTGIDIRNGFFLVQEPNSLVRYDQKNSEPPGPPIPESFSFPVEWEWFAWCDIYLELQTIIT